MKRLFTALAALLLLPCAALAQDVPVPEPTPPEPAAETNTVPPVLLRDIRVQTIGEERHLEELPEGLLFVDATTGKLCLADENDPHGRFVCLCRDIDWHTFTNDLKINGHKLLFNDYWSQVAEGGSLLYRFGTNSWLRFVGTQSGQLANMTVDAFDPTNGTMVVTADAITGTLQVCTNLLEADAWQTATNATVTAVTDASTTWIITLLGTQAEFYRVLATVEREAGIHAERPLHANQGIEMAGERWDAWPDVGAIATNAATTALAPVETRVAVLEERVGPVEWPETCCLYWPVSYVISNWTASNSTIRIPTDFPSRKLDLVVCDQGLEELGILFDYWDPGREVEIVLSEYRSGAPPTTRALHLDVDGVEAWRTTTANAAAGRMITTLQFDPVTSAWTIRYWTVNGRNRYSTPEYSGVVPATRPATVEEWVAMQDGTPAQMLSMSPALSPSLSPDTMDTEENLRTFPEESFFERQDFSTIEEEELPETGTER